jgi:hypothetical protein
VSIAAKDFIRRLLVRDPKERMSGAAKEPCKRALENEPCKKEPCKRALENEPCKKEPATSKERMSGAAKEPCKIES